MVELLACRVCLATGVKFHSIFHHELKKAYEMLTGIKIKQTGNISTRICSFCSSLLRKCANFRDRCLRGQEVLKCALKEQKVLTTEFVSKIDRAAYSVKLPYVIQQIPIPNTNQNVLTHTITITPIQLFRKDLHLPTIQEKPNVIILPSSSETVEKPIKEKMLISAINRESDIDNDSTPLKETMRISAINGESDIDNDSTPIKETMRISAINGESDSDIDITPINEKMQISPHDGESDIDNDNTDEFKDTEYIDTCERDYDPGDNNDDDNDNDDNFDDLYGKDADVDLNHFTIKTFDVILLSKQEQLQEVLDRRNSDNYKKAFIKCDTCFKGFTILSSYKNHLKKHDPSSGPHVCEICQMRWRKKCRLRHHLASTHERKYSCKLCNFTCKNSDAASKHQDWHGGKQYECDKCGAIFAKSTSYFSHVRLQHPSPHRCELCGQQFVSERGLKQHLSIHKTEKNWGPCTRIGTYYCS